MDQNGNLIATDDNAIRRIIASGTVTTIAGQASSGGSPDGDGPEARFSNPKGVSIDLAGNIYVADASNREQRGSVDGVGRSALFAGPPRITLDAQGNLYVADWHNGTIRKIAPAGTVTTVAGTPVLPVTSGSIDGSGQEAGFYAPQGIAIDASGNQLLADANTTWCGKISPSGVVSTLAGYRYTNDQRDGRGAGARFKAPRDVAVDGGGNLYLLATDAQKVANARSARWRRTAQPPTVNVPADPDNVTPLTKTTVAASHMAIAADIQGNYYVASNAVYYSTYCALPDKRPEPSPPPRQRDDLNRTTIR